MKEKAHLTEEGLEQICAIRHNMNSYRESSQKESVVRRTPTCPSEMGGAN